MSLANAITFLGRYTLLFAIALSFSPLVAQDDLDFASMSLEDLLNVEVVTASKKAESQWDAPGVVTVVTKAELEKFGGNNLYEILDRVPGLRMTQLSVAGQPAISSRAGNKFSGSNHTLLLLNGRPFRQSLNGYAYQTVLRSFPIHMIERIEVVRGPGSVLYGTNALEAVVNVITKSPEETSTMLLGGGGTDLAREGEFVVATKSGDLSVIAGVNYWDEDGYPIDGITSPLIPGAPVQGIDIYRDDKSGAMALKFKGFSLSAYGGQFNKHYHYQPDFFTVEHKALLVDAGYEHQINDNWSFTFNITHNQYGEDIINNLGADPVIAFDFNTKDTLMEGTVYGKLGEKVDILVGAVGYYLSGWANFIATTWDLSWRSGYGQVSYQVNDSFKVLGGFQYNETDSGDNTVPRVGVIYNNADSGYGVKLLYGEAFRSPYPNESLIDVPDAGGSKPNPNISAETIESLDLQFFMDKERYQFAATIFQVTQDDFITLLPIEDPIYDFQFQNAGSLDIEGLELEVKYVPSERIYFLGSATYQSNENDAGVDDATLHGDLAVKLGFAYNQGPFNLGIFNSYFEGWKPNSDLPGAPVTAANPPSDDINYLSLNLGYDFSLAGTRGNISLYGKNILDDELYEPIFVVRTINTTQTEGGAQYYGQLKLFF
ncbi:TonB-dependent receptor [Sulfidibacter corallicola]|uniref:TonB-dependent receptor n=1 Tax=Sulfidibacter corallicola TaxID=2818388 RepID=A0A8A4TD52_SULCO|nr:TonB-dependent receptor [Sulfidibacter corallicola]QTD48019.1 TonB-dependent receptor [Sulfidibacter corallicola]